ncbi:MAG TPA: hypothetical protein VFQ61_05415 [Polyangiaceae bacterium]|nr:hypothetical protein [Polyangiaceae bacterium]
MSTAHWALVILSGVVTLGTGIAAWLTVLPALKARAMLRLSSTPSLDRREIPAPREPQTGLVRGVRGALLEARLALLSAETLLKDALRASRLDLLGLAFDRGRAKQSSLGAAARHMRNAQQRIADARRHSANPTSLENIEFDCDPLLSELETSWLGDGLFLDWMVHRRILKALDQVARMLEGTEALIRELDESTASVGE